jgi:hypothetical protein
MPSKPGPRHLHRKVRSAKRSHRPGEARKPSRPAPGCDLSPLFRRIAPTCYDHIGGIVGEELFNCVLSRKWLSANRRTGEASITSLGWNELREFGIDTDRLRTTKRKPVNACVERHGSRLYRHTGSFLGMLLRDRLLELGWLESVGGKSYSLTPKGIDALLRLGIDLARAPGATAG